MDHIALVGKSAEGGATGFGPSSSCIHVSSVVLVEKNQKTFFNFWEVGEVQKAAIFRLGHHVEVELSPDPNGARYETHRVPSYDLDTLSDALENQIGPSVW